MISNEPGYYKDGAFGIRIENIIECKRMKTANSFGDREYLGFATISLAPLCRNLIQSDLLDGDEKGWVDAYHLQVLETIGANIGEDKKVFEWLKKECLPL